MVGFSSKVTKWSKETLDGEEVVLFEVTTVLTVNHAQATQIVKRRFTEFETLKKSLEKGGVNVQSFPSKGIAGIGGDSPEERQV